MLREGKPQHFHHTQSYDPKNDQLRHFGNYSEIKPKQIIEFSVSASKIIIRDDQKNDRTRKLGDRLQSHEDESHPKLILESRNDRQYRSERERM